MQPRAEACDGVGLGTGVGPTDRADAAYDRTATLGSEQKCEWLDATRGQRCAAQQCTERRMVGPLDCDPTQLRSLETSEALAGFVARVALNYEFDFASACRPIGHREGALERLGIHGGSSPPCHDLARDVDATLLCRRDSEIFVQQAEKRGH